MIDQLIMWNSFIFRLIAIIKLLLLSFFLLFAAESIVCFSNGAHIIAKLCFF